MVDIDTIKYNAKKEIKDAKIAEKKINSNSLKNKWYINSNLFEIGEENTIPYSSTLKNQYQSELAINTDQVFAKKKEMMNRSLPKNYR
jgi:hypothetical protein